MIYKKYNNKCPISKIARKNRLEIHHIIPWEKCREHKENNLILLDKEVHDIIHKNPEIYKNKNQIENKKEYIKKLKINYKEYKETNDIKIIIGFLYKLLRYKRSGIEKQTKAEIKLWLKYIKFLIKKGYKIEIEIYFGCSRIYLKYDILESNK